MTSVGFTTAAPSPYINAASSYDFPALYHEHRQELLDLGARMREVFHHMQRQGHGVGLGDVDGEGLYLLIRHCRPSIVFEVSPNAGWSTNYILAALTANQHGTVHSFELLTRYRRTPIEAVIRGNQHSAWDQQRLVLHVGDARQTVSRVNGAVDFLFLDSCHDAWFAQWYIATLFPRVAGPVFIQDIAFADELEYSSEARHVWNWFEARGVQPCVMGTVEAELGRMELRRGLPERLASRSNSVTFQLPEPTRGAMPQLPPSVGARIDQAEAFMRSARRTEADQLLNYATDIVLREPGRLNRHVLLCRIAMCRTALGQRDEARRAYRRAIGMVFETRQGRGLAKGLAEVFCWLGRDRVWLSAMQVLGFLIWMPHLWVDFVAFVGWQLRSPASRQPTSS